MTEEITIDGCNVKDCRRRIGKNNYCRYYKRPCADNNYNCIWKQNLRLKQENEKLKEEYLKLQDDFAIEIQARLYHTDRHVRYAELSKKYRKAFEEIYEIADDTLLCCDDDCGNARKIKLIIDKIDEVLNENQAN